MKTVSAEYFDSKAKIKKVSFKAPEPLIEKIGAKLIAEQFLQHSGIQARVSTAFVEEGVS